MKKKITKKGKREAARLSNLKPKAVARQETARRIAQEKTGHKVVLLNGRFELAPVGFEAPEARASQAERLKQNGLGSDRGLPRGFALKLARKLQAARYRRRRRA